MPDTTAPSLTVILDSDALHFLDDCKSSVEVYTEHVRWLAAAEGFGDVEIEEHPRVSGLRTVRVDIAADDWGNDNHWYDLAESIRREAFEEVIR